MIIKREISDQLVDGLERETRLAYSERLEIRCQRRRWQRRHTLESSTPTIGIWPFFVVILRLGLDIMLVLAGRVENDEIFFIFRARYLNRHENPKCLTRTYILYILLPSMGKAHLAWQELVKRDCEILRSKRFKFLISRFKDVAVLFCIYKVSRSLFKSMLRNWVVFVLLLLLFCYVYKRMTRFYGSSFYHEWCVVTIPFVINYVLLLYIIFASKKEQEKTRMNSSKLWTHKT